MALFVEIVSGPGTGSRYFIDSGQTITLGRSESAAISCPADALLSPLHCSIECDGQECIVRDLQSVQGTFLNGERITEARMHEGDRISAGSLLLAPASRNKPVSTPAPNLTFVNYLRSLPEPLFCLLDAACGPQVFQLIQVEIKSATRIQCLYDGASAQELAAFAPYLVQLPVNFPLLESLVSSGWGKGWASYFTSRSSFEELRHHFRKFLMVKLDTGEEVYFRFYDPRVLTVFLPTCTAAELNDFFGPVEAWALETKDPETLLYLTREPGGLTAKEFRTSLI